MRKTFGILLFSIAFLSTTYAIGQIYSGKDQAMTEPMDRAAQAHLEIRANTAIAGAAQDVLSDEERYFNMTEDGDAANERHLNSTANDQGFNDIPEIEQD